MALVPMDFASHTKEAPLLNQLSSLDKEMQMVLSDSASTDVKFKKYQDAIRRYQHFTDVRDEKVPVPPTNTRREEQILPALPAQQIIRNMPNQKQRSARILLDFLGNIPELGISNNNEIIIDGNTVKNSNIHDLVSDLTRDTRSARPRGSNEFTQLLRAKNVPLEAIGSSRRKNLFTIDSDDEDFGRLPSRNVSRAIISSARPLSMHDFPTHSRFNLLDDSDEGEEDPPGRKKSKRISAQGVQRNFGAVVRGDKLPRTYKYWHGV